jgi:hypothetical protein
MARVSYHISAADYRPIHAYLRKKAPQFRVYSLGIKPDHADRRAVLSRVSFAILSANCPFEQSVKALDYVLETDFQPDEERMGEFRCIPEKAAWIRAIAARPFQGFLRHESETWQTYRERIMRTTPGLGRCKASFAVALLYPDTANVVVIDTWICKTYFGTDAFVSISKHNYERVERDVIRIGKAHGLCGFQAHWAIWAFSSGIEHDHDIFPGGHKDAEAVPF